MSLSFLLAVTVTSGKRHCMVATICWLAIKITVSFLVHFLLSSYLQVEAAMDNKTDAVAMHS